MTRKQWGKSWALKETSRCRVVYIEAEENWQCSVHFHQWMDNGFFVISGILQVVEYPDSEWETKKTLSAGDSCSVKAQVPHCFRSLTFVEAVECYSSVEGKTCSVDDIVRLSEGKRLE